MFREKEEVKKIMWVCVWRGGRWSGGIREETVMTNYQESISSYYIKKRTPGHGTTP